MIVFIFDPFLGRIIALVGLKFKHDRLEFTKNRQILKLELAYHGSKFSAKRSVT